MNNYMFIKYKNYSFTAPLHIKINGVEITVNCKIDTGCMQTSIPMKKLLIGNEDTKNQKSLKLKQHDIDNRVEYNRSYGVSDTNTTRKHDEYLISTGNIIDCTSIKFKHKADIFEISNFDLGTPIIGVNYDRTGNILIGMDIMKDWDIHIGKDVNTEETLFIACPYNKINNDYLLALERHFNVGSSINSAILRDKMKTIK